MADLPFEILELIFAKVAETPSFTHPPRRLSEVCKLWKAVSFSFPEIRNIFPLFELGSGRYRLPLRQTLKVSEGLLKFSATSLTPVLLRHPDFERLQELAQSWGHVELLSLHPDALRSLSVGLVNRALSVHTLKIRLLDSATGYAGHFYAFEKAVGLRHLEVESSRASLFLKVPFGKLEQYVERSKSAIGVTQVLHHNSSIQSFSYFSADHIPIVTTLAPDGPIPHLTTLNLHLRGTALMVLLPPLKLPALERLKVVSDNAINIVDNVSSLISRSACSLITLSIFTNIDARTPSRDFDHSQLLSLCHSLQNLEINNLRPSLLSELLARETGVEGGSLLPDLRELIVHIPNERHIREVVSWAPYSHRRLGFIRLVFPHGQTGDERLKAQRYLERDAAIDARPVPDALLDAVDTLEKEWMKIVAARKTTESTIQKLWKPFSRNKQEAIIDRALSYIEQYDFQHPFQVVVRRFLLAHLYVQC